MKPLKLSDREKVVADTINENRADVDKLAKDIITALFLGGWLDKDDDGNA